MVDFTEQRGDEVLTSRVLQFKTGARMLHNDGFRVVMGGVSGSHHFSGFTPPRRPKPKAMR